MKALPYLIIVTLGILLFAIVRVVSLPVRIARPKPVRPQLRLA